MMPLSHGVETEYEPSVTHTQSHIQKKLIT